MKNKRVMILNNKVFIRKLDVKNPPLDALGGRILLETGEIAQIINGEKFQYLAYIEFSGNYEIQRGNHYHHSKDEYLYIVKGRIRVIFEDIDTKEVEECILETGDIVNTKPRCAHVYFPLEYSQAIEFSPCLYDSRDTHKYIVNIPLDKT